MSRLTVLLSSLCLMGCVSGFDRSALREQLSGYRAEAAEESIEKLKARKPRLKFPCNVAVYLYPDDADSSWSWSSADRAYMESWGTRLKQEGVVEGMFIISDMFTNGKDLPSLRRAAAKYNADVLLVVKGATQTQNYVNPGALANLTLLGGFVVPGQHCDAMFLLQAGVVDVSSGVVCASLESEGEARLIKPSFLLKQEDAIGRAKRHALEKFGPVLSRRMHGLQNLYNTQMAKVRKVQEVTKEGTKK
ncbi:MAG: hypothetical protein ACFCD0_15320 [Gemmataceae bacterium]